MKKFISPVATGILLFFLLGQSACKKSMLSPEDAGYVGDGASNDKGTSSLLLTQERFENLGLNVNINNTSSTVGTGTGIVQFYYNGYSPTVHVKINWHGNTLEKDVLATHGTTVAAYFNMSDIPNAGCEVTTTVTDSLVKTARVMIGPRSDVYIAGVVHTLQGVNGSLNRTGTSTLDYVYNFSFYWYKPAANYFFTNEQVFVSVRFFTVDAAGHYTPTNTIVSSAYINQVQSLLMAIPVSQAMNGVYFKVVAGSTLASVDWPTHPTFNNLPYNGLVFDANGHNPYVNQITLNGIGL